MNTSALPVSRPAAARGRPASRRLFAVGRIVRYAVPASGARGSATIVADAQLDMFGPPVHCRFLGIRFVVNASPL
ncbi:hypothetical protein CAL28_28350 [Bordetella genomosp. 11]|uniref:Uncharacterized protein n=1 Tax=Bordetella genomosp. 11 TaxID=1416808 RepID=A0A261UMC5_9BORD|nr:hypothetical protein CAL28_28350 [Bordetella genomosp. 11]